MKSFAGMTTVPDLSMLWEPVDARGALRERFGFPAADDAVAWLTSALEEHWSSPLDRCDRLVISDTNLLAWVTTGGRPVVAKWCVDSSRFDRLREVDALVAWLACAGAPVAAAIPTREGLLRVNDHGSSLALYPCIDGELLDDTDATQVETAGRTLATLHQTLSGYPHAFGADPAEPPHQLVHGDFRAANILTVDRRITAVLDFENAGYGSPIADLAKAAVLLGTRYHDWCPTMPEVRDRFVTAYNSVAPLSRSERDELEQRIARVLEHFGW